MRHVDLVNAKERIEDGVRFVQRDQLRPGYHAADLSLEVVPLAQLEVVEDDEPALLQVRAQALGLLIGHHPEAGLPHHGDRIVEEAGIVQREVQAAVGPGANQREVVEHPHQVLLGSRELV